MKHLLLALLLVATSNAFAQVSIEFSPNTIDSARFVLTRTATDGSVTTYTSPFDTITKIIEQGRELYINGGFIGQAPVTGFDDYWTDRTRQFIAGGFYDSNSDSWQLGNALSGATSGLHPGRNDTLTNYSFVGSWDTNGKPCGIPDDEAFIVVEPFGLGGHGLNVRGDGNVLVTSVWTMGEGEVYLPNIFGTYTTLIQIDEDTWKGPNGCIWTRQ